MAQLHTTGPAHAFVKLPKNSSVLPFNANLGSPTVNLGTSRIYYLGTAETKPRIQIRKANKPIYNDIGGDMVPFDKLYQGEEAYAFFDFNRFNYPVMEALQETPNVRQRAGVDGPGDVGTLWLAEEANIELYILFPYRIKAAYRNAGMRRGYRFPFATWEGPEDQQIGTDVHKRLGIFHAIRGYYPATGAFLLYDEAGLDNLPAID